MWASWRRSWGLARGQVGALHLGAALDGWRSCARTPPSGSTQHEPIEGASQRLHEDTQRFSNGLETCLITLLDAAFTLVIFSPILFELSVQVAPPIDLGGLSKAWLWMVAWLASLIGLGGAALVGQRLVGLEVENQRVEALLRKDLVLLETTPAVIVGTASGDPTCPLAPPPLTLPPEQARAFGPAACLARPRGCEQLHEPLPLAAQPLSVGL